MTNHSPIACCQGIIPKNLAFNHSGVRRKNRLISNFIKFMGFEPGQRIKAISYGNFNGFTIVPDENGTQQVYSRAYKRVRSNNSLEAVVEFGGQSLLRESFPSIPK